MVPGLVMMSVLQNAFANSSSLLIQSMVTGNLVFLLVTPLSHHAWYAACDVSPWLSLAVVGTAFVIVAITALELLRRGYKLRA